MLIVGLVLLRLCCVGKTARRQIVNVPQVALSNEEKLSHQEISKYFPPIVAQSVLPKQAMNHLECAVCLTDIEKNSIIRVTYCKHIFHGHCLSSWFEKTQVLMEPRRVVRCAGTRWTLRRPLRSTKWCATR